MVVSMQNPHIYLPLGPSTSYTGAYFGQGTGIILFSDLNCNGIESSLFSCPYSESIGHTTCTHSRDAGVSCSQLGV